MERASLKEQLVECADDIDAIVKQVLEKLLVEKKVERSGPTTSTGGEKLSTLVELFHQRVLDYNKHLKKVENHREQEEYIRELEKCVHAKDSLIKKIAFELKYVESALNEATYQAEKKLKSVKESETNRAFSEDVIRLAHQISKSHSVASSMYWQQGDPQRPYPTEAEFATSSLQLSRNNQGQSSGSGFLRQSSASGINRTASSGALGHLRGSPMNNTSIMNTTINSSFGLTHGGQAKSFSPSPRSGIFGQAGLVGAGLSSPGSGQRGRPPGSGTRMTSPSARAIHPTILAGRAGRPASQSPRTNMQTSPAITTNGSQAPFGYGPGTGITINLPPSMGGQASKGQQPEKVEQMSSDSSSSSSSGDEG